MAQQAAETGLDPTASYVNISCFDLLLVELIPLAERMAREYEASLDRPSLVNKTTPSSASNKNTHSAAASTAGGGAGGGAGPAVMAGDGQPETELFKETMHYRLESLGYRVGLGLSERFSRDRPRSTDQLDVIKFLCKDLWMVVFKKQIDNLKTNHRGVFVLTDNKFRPFSRMSMANAAEAVHKAQPHLIFPCGIIRGALASLGVVATVQAESQDLPAATFQIKMAQAKP